MNNDSINDGPSILKSAVQAVFQTNEEYPTPERIREVAVAINIGLTKMDSEAVEKVAKSLEANYGVIQNLGYMLASQDHEPWLANAMEDIDPYYWDRYRKYLGQTESLPLKTIGVLDEETQIILDRLENPNKEGSWSRRGMIMGHVQSGKTTNFAGLICKAADAGYKVIIILSGLHNMLRNQTQSRMDHSFVGVDSAKMMSNQPNMIGVGKITNIRNPLWFTNSLKDFDKAVADSVGVPIKDIKEPALFVVKKNDKSLQKMYDWLKSTNTGPNSPTISHPLLVIDDEADNASINTKKAMGKITKINGQIRSLLELFERNAYVGYTATPFANIFIIPETDDEIYGDDLFPRHFIRSLSVSNQYIGPDQIFLENGCSYIRAIEDNEDTIPVKHNKYLEIDSLPDSLKYALKTFVIARAIRLARGHQGFHSTMLVNVSVSPAVHNILKFRISSELQALQARIKNKSALAVESALKDSVIKELYEVWDAEFKNTEFGWITIQQLLHKACAPIEILEINGKSGTPLKYSDHKTGRSVIAVGGFSLSRGLTLEGLTVSYVIRNSSQQDTLMQMGRWFGYRPDYDDLCRLWLLPECIDNFSKTAETIQELRELLIDMSSADASPEEFGLRVRNHPGRLMITAKNKIGYAKTVTVNARLDLSLVETFALRGEPSVLDSNLYQLEVLSANLLKHDLKVTDAVWDEVSNNGWLLKNIPVSCVKNFILGFQNSSISLHTQTSALSQYIDKRADDELCLWDVLFTSSIAASSSSWIYDDLGFKINCRQRTLGVESSKDVIYIGGSRQRRLGQPSHEAAGLTKEQKHLAVQGFFEANPEKPKTTTVPGKEYRKVPGRNPLLIIHVINLSMNEKIENKEALNHYLNRPVLSWSISFPSTKTPSDYAEYLLPKSAVQLSMNLDDEDSEEDNDID